MASVLMSQADLYQAEIELGYTTVTSPISGYISESKADLGTLVGPSSKSHLATIIKMDTVLIDFSMTALDYLKSKERNVELGQQDTSRSWQQHVTITLADNTIYPYKGLVDFAAPQVDEHTGTFSVRAEIKNPDRILLPGQFTKVKVLLDIRENAKVVPLKAVDIDKGGAYIYVMRKDSTVERQFCTRLLRFLLTLRAFFAGLVRNVCAPNIKSSTEPANCNQNKLFSLCIKSYMNDSP